MAQSFVGLWLYIILSTLLKTLELSFAAEIYVGYVCSFDCSKTFVSFIEQKYALELME